MTDEANTPPMTVAPPGDHIYAEMGLRPCIVGIGGVTLLGSSTVSPRVMKAIQDANDRFIVMHELLDRAGEMIAEMLGAEAAAVTTGTTCGLVLSTAAAMCGTDVEKISRIPDTEGLKNEVIIQGPVRWIFARSVTQTGATLVTAGSETSCTPDDLRAAVGPRTAAILYNGLKRLARETDVTTSLEESVAIGKAAGVPVIADAAGQVLPYERHHQFAAVADLGCFGSKYIGGPNSVGYVTGRADLIEAVRAQGFVEFDEASTRGITGGIGRPFKLDRGDIVAAVVSLQEWLETDHVAWRSDLQDQLRSIAEAVADIPGVIPQLHGRPEDLSEPVALWITIDPNVVGHDARQIADALAAGDPPIWIGWMRRRPDELSVTANGPRMLRSGEEKVIADRLRRAIVARHLPTPTSTTYHPASLNRPEAVSA